MREITRSVKVALKFLIAVVLVDVDLPYCTSKVEHIVAFTTIFSNICTAHAQKRLFMNFRCKFRHRRSIRRPRFPVGVQNFGDLETFYVDFCILYSECPPYFYFRFVRPTDLESIPHASTPTSIIPTKFEVACAESRDPCVGGQKQLHHGQRGSASPVLTATGFVNGR